MIVTGTTEGLVCVNTKTGALLWGNKFSAGNTANCPTPAYSDGHVFWANGYGKGGICMKLAAAGGRVTCLELATGKTMWKNRGVGKGSILWAEGMLYLFGEGGGKAALAICSPEGMQMKGQFSVAGSGPSWAHPVVIGGRLYLRYDTNLYCYELAGGK